MFLDESTSAMDEGLELMLYELIRAELPDAILVSVSHRGTWNSSTPVTWSSSATTTGGSTRSRPGVRPSKKLTAGCRGTLPE